MAAMAANARKLAKAAMKAMAAAKISGVLKYQPGSIWLACGSLAAKSWRRKQYSMAALAKMTPGESQPAGKWLHQRIRKHGLALWQSWLGNKQPALQRMRQLANVGSQPMAES